MVQSHFFPAYTEFGWGTEQYKIKVALVKAYEDYIENYAPFEVLPENRSGYLNTLKTRDYFFELQKSGCTNKLLEYQAILVSMIVFNERNLM